MDEYEEGGEVSRYNDAWFAVQRLNESWNKCAFHIRHKRFPDWKLELDIVLLELDPDMQRHKKSKEFEKTNQKTMKKISKAKTLSQRFFALYERHRFLRYVQNECGKGSTYVDEYAEDAE